MRYSECPNFPTRSWNQLWRNNIEDLESLKRYAELGAAFVAIDAEPWSENLSEIAEIGLALIPEIHGLGEPPKTIESLLQQHPVQARRIRISGRQLPSGRRNGRERQLAAVRECVVEPCAINETLLRILQDFQTLLQTSTSYSSIEKQHLSPLVLMGFDLGFEIKTILSINPDISKYVSHWVDIQELVRSVSSQPNHGPSMRNSLIVFGFGGDCQAVGRSRERHNAGNDTIRMIALLVNLLVVSQDTPPFEIEYRTVGKWNPKRHYLSLKAQNLFSHRPTPWDKFPFMARVRVQGGAGAKFSVDKLSKSFPGHNPTALGYKKATEEGFVCLPSLKELDDFVDQLNGREISDGRVWEVISEFDPDQNTLRTASDVSEYLKAKANTEMEVKKENRRRKREKEELKREIIKSKDGLDLGI